MFLRSLTLKGFKSFADKTTLEFEPGVTVVVGPERQRASRTSSTPSPGCSAPRRRSAVRGQKMDDVIFAGTAKRPALGRAEVALTIDNTAGLLPIEFTEVTITRTLFRTGETEYAINGVPCRLLDIQELLSDTGIGRQQHVIVGQGQLDAVLNARPEDRRAIIEEAAGVLKFRKRKEKAERRLEATEGNLLRLQDLLREVRRQLRPLERQAEAARRHGELVAELHGAAPAPRRPGDHRPAHPPGDAGRPTDAPSRRPSRRSRPSWPGSTPRCWRPRPACRPPAGADLGDDLARAEQLRERARGLAAVLAERRRGAGRRARPVGRGRCPGRRCWASRSGCEAERDEVAEAAVALDPERLELEADTAALAADRAAFEAADADGTVTSPAGRRGRRRRRGAGRAAHRCGRSVAQAEGDAGRLATRRGQLHERGRAPRRRDRAAPRRVRGGRGGRAPAGGRARGGRGPPGRSSTRRSAGPSRPRRRPRRPGAPGPARAEALALALDQARARAGAERLAGVAGTLGTLLELVDVDDGWAPAFEAAAGDALAAVVVDSVDGGPRARSPPLAPRAASAAPWWPSARRGRRVRARRRSASRCAATSAAPIPPSAACSTRSSGRPSPSTAAGTPPSTSPSPTPTPPS